MSLLYNVTMNIYSLIILTVIYTHTKSHSESNYYNTILFLQMLLITFLMLIFDSFGRFDGLSNGLYPILNHMGNFMLFILIPLLPSVWIQYAYFQITNDEKSTKNLAYPLAVVNVANIFMVIGNLATGWYYYIDSGNIYHRGNLYLLSTAVTFTLLIISFIFIFRNRKQIEREYYLSLLLFPLVPVIGVIIQSLFYGVSLILPGIMISILIVFLNLQNSTINRDYLTGAGNQRKFENYLKNKIKMSDKVKTFSAVMLDLDNFKGINDKYGHEAGDLALIKTVEIIKSEISAKDLVARSGGDEFWIILNSDDEKHLEQTINNINLAFESYNESSKQPFDLNFSCGCAVYDYKSKMSDTEFRKYVDSLMYKNKDSKDIDW